MKAQIVKQTQQRSSKPQRPANCRREAVIAAARSLFSQYGFHRTGMALIARKSRVLVGQIYRDFASKETLIATIVERDLSDMLDDPGLVLATMSGQTVLLSNWVRRFVTRDISSETRNILADILSVARRNPRIAAMLAAAHTRLRQRLIAAAMVWAPQPELEAARRELADLILTAAGAIRHHQLSQLNPDEKIVLRFLGLIEAEIAKLKLTSLNLEDGFCQFE